MPLEARKVLLMIFKADQDKKGNKSTMGWLDRHSLLVDESFNHSADRIIDQVLDIEPSNLTETETVPAQAPSSVHDMPPIDHDLSVLASYSEFLCPIT